MDPAVLTGLAALITAVTTGFGGYLLARKRFKVEERTAASDREAKTKADEYERMVQLMGQYVVTLDQYRKDVEYVRNELTLEREECDRRIEELRENYEAKIAELLKAVKKLAPEVNLDFDGEI